MKIAMIGQKGIPALSGGVERHVEEISKRLVAQGHDVTVFCRSTYSESRRASYQGVILKYIKTINNKSAEAIVYSLKASWASLLEDYDLIHYHAIGPASTALIPKLFRRKVIVTVHGLDWQRDKWGRLAKMYLKFGEKASGWFSDKIISVSENLRDYYLTRYKRPHDDVFFIPNGVQPLAAVEPSEIYKYGLEKEDYILFLARLVPEKGAHYLIDSFQKLKTDKKLVIAGGSSFTDEYVNTLKQKAKGNPNIIFTGAVQGRFLQELYSNAYLYVLPSDIEGMPITLLEAMSYARCCLTSNLPENVGILKDCFGYVFKRSDINSLAEKIEFLLQNPELVTKTGKKAYEEVKNNYNWDAIVEKTIAVYKTLNRTNRNQRFIIGTANEPRNNT
jgi:glycosyltransferase involved in cell wall biosynthesis